MYWCINVVYYIHCFTDAESQQREECLGSLPIHQPRPRPRQCLASEIQVTSQKPPVKPRRSIKGRPAAQQETDQIEKHGQQKENEVNGLTLSCNTWNYIRLNISE